MRKIELSNAKQKLSALIDQVSKGESIGIRRHGKLVALIIPVPPELTLQAVFDDIERIRKKVALPNGSDIRALTRRDHC